MYGGASGDWNRYAVIKNSELRQLGGRIRSVKNELYKLPLIDTPSMTDVVKNIGAWRNTESRFAKNQNLQEFITTVEFLRDNGISNFSDMVRKSEELHDDIREHADLVRNENKRIDTLSMHLAQYDIYSKNRSLAKKYNEQPEKNKAAFYEKHKDRIDNYKSAYEYLTKVMNGKGTPPIKAWDKKLKGHLKLRWKLCDIYYDIRSEIKLLENIRRTIDHLMADVHDECERNNQRQKLSEIEI
jgi:hypothetical protein